MKRIWITLVAVLGWMSLPGVTEAQNLLYPPELTCIKNDTLFWDLPTGNTCGPFQARLLFGSLQPGGPYQLIATITDPNQTSYHHASAGNQVWYYYMQSSHQCPGFVRLSSDTLSGAPIPRVILAAVTVNGGHVQLSWPASQATQADRYIIYRNTPGGTVPIDTVFGTTTYTDTTANPDSRSEIYYVLAADACGNTSLFDVLHQTIHLQETVDPCARTIDLSWNPYVNWTGGVDRQEVWVSRQGGQAQLLATLDPSATSYSIPDVDAQTSYCVTIRAFEAGTASESRSNERCLTPDIIQPPRQMQIKYIGVNATPEIELEWIWEPYAELELAGIARRETGGVFQPIQPVTVTMPLLAVNTYADPGADPSARRWEYQVFARDLCGQDWQSAPAAPVWLRATARPDQMNELVWTPLFIVGAIIENYEVFERRGNLILPLGQTTDTFFLHTPEDGLPSQEAVCYEVEATYRIALPGGTERRISRSNRACARQEIRVWVPNAFAPRGINNEFKPLVVPAGLTRYAFSVFNRWGGEIFRSTDPAMGWTGKTDAGEALSGIYVWTLDLTGPDGKTISASGTVMLVR